jgi:hypothetical protein
MFYARIDTRDGRRSRIAYRRCRLERLEERALLAAGALIGVDFDQGNTHPANWTGLHRFVDTVTLTDLVDESGDVSEVDLTLSNGYGDDFPIPLIASTLPAHTASLQGLDGGITAGGPQSATMTITWSGLDPGARYEVYVFGLADVPPELNVPVALSINGVQGSSDRTLASYATVTTANDAGQITTQGTGDLAGVAIRELIIQQVTADWDVEEPGQAELFGTYLAGVILTETFTVTLEPAAVDTIDAVTYRIGSGTTANATQSDDVWVFQTDPGQLDAGSHGLTVDASAGGVVRSTYQGTIEVVDQLSFAAKAKVTTDPGGPIDTSSVRLIEDIPVTLAFTVTSDEDVLWNAYADRLRVMFEEPGGQLPPQLQGGANVTFTVGGEGTFALASGFLPNVTTDTQADYHLYLAPRASFAETADVRLSDGSATIYVAPLPDWVGTPVSKSFVADAEVASVFGTGAAAYVIDLGRWEVSSAGLIPSEARARLEEYKALVGGLTTELVAGANLKLYAKLDRSVNAVLRPADWRISITILDKSIVNDKSLDPGDASAIYARANLDGMTFDFQSLRVKAVALDLKQLLEDADVATAFSLPLGSSSRQWTLPIPGSPLGVSGKLSVKGDLAGILDHLLLNTDLTFQLDTQQRLEIAKNSYMNLDVSAGVNGMVQINGSAGLTLIPLWLFAPAGIDIVSAYLSGDLWAQLRADLQLGVSGPLTDLAVTFDVPPSHGSLEVGYRLKWNYCLFSADCPSGQVDERTVRDSATILLFGTPTPDKPNFQDPNATQIKGPGQTKSEGFEGVQPTEGDSLSVVGNTGSDLAATPAAALQSAAVTAEPLSSLTLETAIADNVTSIHFDYNALASAANLTAEEHFLETRLIGGDAPVVLSRLDLADLTYQANANPLGFSSGWLTAELPVNPDLFDSRGFYHLEIALFGGPNESVAVALDNLQLAVNTPSLSLEATTGTLHGDVLAITNDQGTARGVITATNTGQAALSLQEISVAGTNLKLLNAGDATILLPGERIEIQTEVDRVTRSAVGRLHLASGDPEHAAVDLVLHYALLSPEGIGLLGDEVRENAAQGTVVGLLSAPPASAEPLTFELIAGEGDSGNGRFRIVGNQLLTHERLDYESQSQHSLRIRATDGSGGVQESAFTVFVGNLHDLSTPGLFDAATATFYLHNANLAGVADYTFGYGNPAAPWIKIIGDWNGDGADSIGFFDPSSATWYLRNGLSSGFADWTFGYGDPQQTSAQGDRNWRPLVGDWDGDGVDTIGLFDPVNCVWYLRNSLSSGFADWTFGYGDPQQTNGQGDRNWQPLVGDWNGDGFDTIGFFAPVSCTWYLRNALSAGFADHTFGFGDPSLTIGHGDNDWTPIVGDWDGNGADAIALFDPLGSTFMLRNALTTGAAERTFGYGVPAAGWQPLAGCWYAGPELSGDAATSLTAEAVDQIDLAALVVETLTSMPR